MSSDNRSPIILEETTETNRGKTLQRSRSSSDTHAQVKNDDPFATTAATTGTATTSQVSSGGRRDPSVGGIVGPLPTSKHAMQTGNSVGSSFKSEATNPRAGKLHQKSSRATNTTNSFSTADPMSSEDLSQWSSYKSGLGLAQKAKNGGGMRPSSPGFALPQETLTEELPSSPPKYPGTPSKGHSPGGTPDKTRHLFRSERSGSQSSVGSSSRSKRSPLGRTKHRNNSSLDLDDNDSVVEIWKGADDAGDSPVAYRVGPPENSEREVTTQSRTITSMSNDSEGILFRTGKNRHDASPTKSTTEQRSASIAASENREKQVELTPLNDDKADDPSTRNSNSVRTRNVLTSKHLSGVIEEHTQSMALWSLCLIILAQYVLQSTLFTQENSTIQALYALPLVVAIIALTLVHYFTSIGRKYLTLVGFLAVLAFLAYHTVGIFTRPEINSGNVFPLVILAPFLFGGNMLLVGSTEALVLICTVIGHFTSGRSTNDQDLFQLVTMALLIVCVVLLEMRRGYRKGRVADATVVDPSKEKQRKDQPPAPPPRPFKGALKERLFLSEGEQSPPRIPVRGEQSDSTTSDSSHYSCPDYIFPSSLQNRPIRSQSMSLNVGHERNTTVSRIQKAYFNLAHSTSELMKQFRSFLGHPSGKYSRVPEEEYPSQQYSSMEVKKALETAQRELHVARLLGVHVPRRRLSKKIRDTQDAGENEEALQHIIDMISPAHANRTKRGSDVAATGQDENRSKGASEAEAIHRESIPPGNNREERISTSSSSNCLTKVEGVLQTSTKVQENPSRCNLYSLPASTTEAPSRQKSGTHRNSAFNIASPATRIHSAGRKKRSLSTSELPRSNALTKRRADQRRLFNWEDPRYFGCTSSVHIKNVKSASVDVFESARRYLRNTDSIFGSIYRPEELQFPFVEMEHAAFTQAEPLITVMGKIFQENLISFESIGISRNMYLRFFELVESRYQANPYHNKFHAADVASTTYRLACNSRMFKSMTSLDQLALVTAAAVHDLDHPGSTNTFLINVQDPIAIRYNDKSVLENHHVASAFALLTGDRNGHMLEHLSKEDYFKFRQTVIELVLITDLAHHMQFVDEYREMIAENEPTVSEETNEAIRTWSSGSIGQMKQSFGWDDGCECKHTSLDFVMKCPKCHTFASSLKTLGETVHSGLRSRKDQLLVWKLLLKAADVGHAAKPASLHLKWSQRIVEEMFRQGDVERTMGMSVSPLMNRNKIDSLSKSQVGFIDFICMPLFQSWDAVALASIAYTSISSKSDEGKRRNGQEKEFHELCLDALNVQSDDLFMAPMASKNRELWENMQMSHSS